MQQGWKHTLDSSIDCEIVVGGKDFGQRRKNRFEVLECPDVRFSVLVILKDICNILCRVVPIDDSKDVEWEVILVLAHGNIVDDHIAILMCKVNLSWRHPEDTPKNGLVSSGRCIGVNVHNPARVVTLQPNKLVNEGVGIAS